MGAIITNWEGIELSLNILILGIRGLALALSGLLDEGDWALDVGVWGEIAELRNLSSRDDTNKSGNNE